MRATDAWTAVALVRPDDLRALPAWLGLEQDDPALDDVAEAWPLVAERTALRPAAEYRTRCVARVGVFGAVGDDN